MKRFHVWVRSLENSCRVRVDGVENGRWLLDQLGRAFVFKSCEPIHEDQASCSSIFRVSYNSLVSPSILRKTLAAIPEVQLMADPA